MTEPTPTPETQNLPAAPDENTEERDGFFRRVRRELRPDSPPVNPSEAAEIVVEDEDG
jgi:hypothetical protein